MIVRRFRRAAVYAAVFGVGASAHAPQVLAGSAWPASIAGQYKFSFNGFEVGAYQFQHDFNGKTYAASGTAEISAMFGAFTWKGTIKSQGTIDALAPTPTAYLMSYEGKKVGSVAIAFDKRAVKSYEVLPPKPPNPEAIPVKTDDLKSVFDPMTAILAISHTSGGKPCERSIPVFDGKTRFNLVMSYKGTEKTADKRPSGLPSQLIVCNVKYVPVAGHKPKDFTNPWVGYDKIEIALRPVPSANIFVPYRITVPTTIGSAIMSADKITITSADNAEIALSQ